MNSVPRWIQHFTHPKHPLKEVYKNTKFKCKACKSEGQGVRFRCDRCDFNIHGACGSCPIYISSFTHPQHCLQRVQKSFFSKKCNLCKESIKGMVYRCRACGFYLHPLCSQVPEFLVNHEIHPIHHLRLELRSSKKCDVCRKRCKNWRYHCADCDVHIHVGCLSGKPKSDSDGEFGKFLVELLVNSIQAAAGISAN